MVVLVLVVGLRGTMVERRSLASELPCLALDLS